MTDVSAVIRQAFGDLTPDELMALGQVTRIADGPKYKVVGNIADWTLLRGVMNVNGWNQYHIIARGPVLIQILNGQLVAVTLDEDTKNATPAGVLGFQMHTGPPFKVQYRNVMYKRIN